MTARLRKNFFLDRGEYREWYVSNGTSWRVRSFGNIELFDRLPWSVN